MDDLIAFLNARLGEDEAAATAALESEWFAHVTEFASADQYEAFGDLAVDYCQWLPDEADGAHVARHDPARVLREAASKRAHIRMWEAFAKNFTHIDETVFEFAKREALEDVLAHDAAAWGDHPDYRQEWKP